MNWRWYLINYLMVRWWPERELNPRHKDFQSSALPTELSGQKSVLNLILLGLVNVCLHVKLSFTTKSGLGGLMEFDLKKQTLEAANFRTLEDKGF